MSFYFTSPIMDSSEYLFRALIIGDTGVGKTCFLLRFTENRFKESHNVTIGVEFGAKQLTVAGHSVKLQIWDTAGQESFRSITRSFYRKADGVLLMFDVTDAQSFENCAFWVKEVQENALTDVAIYLVGNQVDAEEREVTVEQAQELVNKFHLAGYKETSAKSGLNVEAAFHEFSTILISKSKTASTEAPTSTSAKSTSAGVSLSQTQPSKSKKKSCC